MKAIKAASIILATTLAALPAAAGTLVVSPSGKTIQNDGLPGQGEIRGVGIREGKANPPSDDPSPDVMFAPGMPDGATNRGARDIVDFNG